MAWDSSKPGNSDKLKDFPPFVRAMWAAMEALTDASLLITNDKISPTAGIVDTKLAQLTTPSKVSGAAITALGSVPSGAGALPDANAPTTMVKTTGDQTIAGIKTFSSIPVLPASSPTTDNQATRKKYVDDLVAAVTASITGEIREWGGAIATIPAGWLHCSGAAVSRSTYAALFSAIGTIHGIGDGSTTFNLPARKNMIPVGADSDASGVPKNNLEGTLKQKATTTDALAQPPGFTYPAGPTSGPSGPTSPYAGSFQAVIPPHYTAVYMIKT